MPPCQALTSRIKTAPAGAGLTVLCIIHSGSSSKARYGVAASLRAGDLPGGAVQGRDIASQHIAGDEWARQVAVGDEPLWVEERAVNKRLPVR